MLKRTIVAATLVLAVMVVGEGRKGWAQQASATKAPDTEKQTYRVDFSVNEMEDGKKVNSRQYSMNLNAGTSSEIKIGTRVPVEEKAGEFIYLDVGTNVWCMLRDRSDSDYAWLGNAVSLTVRSEISNFAVPEQQGQNLRPLLRQLKIQASTVAQPGKPLVVGSVDDPNSKRQFQLEVTATKLR